MEQAVGRTNQQQASGGWRSRIHGVLFVVVVSLTLARPVCSQGSSPPVTPAQARAAEARRDAAVSQLRAAESLYVALLEKTNSQLNLRLTPVNVYLAAVGVFVAALGTLFAVAAIVVAIYLFRQSADYKKLISESIQKYQTILDALWQGKLKEIETYLETEVQKVTEQVRTATQSDKRTLEGRLESLQKQLQELREAPPPSPVHSGISFEARPWSARSIGWMADVISPEKRVCSNCGKIVSVPRRGLLGDALSQETKCPNCGSTIKV